MAIGYYVIGNIQSQKYPYFKANVDSYGTYQKEKLFDDKYFHSNVGESRI